MSSNVKLISSDGDVFSVSQNALTLSSTLNNLLRGDSEPVLLKNVSSEILTKVIIWCEHEFQHPQPREQRYEPSDWEKEFFKVSHEMLFALVLAGNELGIDSLLDAGCKVVAGLMAGKSPEEFRALLEAESNDNEAHN